MLSDSILTDWEILLACLMKWVAMMEKFSWQETVTLSRTRKQLPVNSQQKVGAFSHATAKTGFQNTKVLWARKYILLHLSLEMTIQVGYYFHCNLVRTQSAKLSQAQKSDLQKLWNKKYILFEVKFVIIYYLEIKNEYISLFFKTYKQCLTQE